MKPSPLHLALVSSWLQQLSSCLINTNNNLSPMSEHESGVSASGQVWGGESPWDLVLGA